MLDSLKHDETLIVHKDELPYLGVLLAQMSLKQGLKAFGKKTENCTLKEMTHLHDMVTFFLETMRR